MSADTTTRRGKHPDRVAIVTGGARGIGAAIARRLGADGLAVGVVDLDHDSAARIANEIIESGGRAVAKRCDVADSEAAAQTVADVSAALGPVTVLVNNAGILRDNLIFKMGVEDWDDVMNVHLRGAFLMTRAAQAHMVEAKWGRIVNLSSTSALGNRGQVNYAAAKAGVQGFTKSLAFELGKFGITANVIAPGLIESEMTRATAARVGAEFEDWKQAASRNIPVGRIGQPEDIAAVASFLCREETGFVSGQVIYVAGGPKD